MGWHPESAAPTAPGGGDGRLLRSCSVSRPDGNSGEAGQREGQSFTHFGRPSMVGVAVRLLTYQRRSTGLNERSDESRGVDGDGC